MTREDVEKLVKELTEKPFIMGINAIETESFRILKIEKKKVKAAKRNPTR